MISTLYDTQGRRKYLTSFERKCFLEAAMRQPAVERAFCMTLAFTGCRLSECLNLTLGQFDSDNHTVVIESLKKRRRGHFRAVPVPESLIYEISKTFDRGNACQQYPWPWGRTKGYQIVKSVMSGVGISGAHVMPKGLRHGFAVNALSSGVPINLVSRWMGHSSLEMTSIYLDVIGAEEYQIAERMWS